MASTAILRRIQPIGQCPTEIYEPPAKIVTRNSKPCSACSFLHRRCNILPPFSNILCQRCAKKGFAECPPHVSRKILFERRAQEAFQLNSDKASLQPAAYEAFTVERLRHANNPLPSDETLINMGFHSEGSNSISVLHPVCGINPSWNDHDYIAWRHVAQEWYYGVFGPLWLPGQPIPTGFFSYEL